MADAESSSSEPIEYMLTTVDNPFDPFTQFKEWYAFDMSHGYHTPSLLARVVKYSNDLSPADQAAIIQQGIDEVARENVSGMHKKVARTSSAQSSSSDS